MARKLIGRYIVADDAICHGQVTIRGTRILVANVLAMVRQGRDWTSISDAWRGKISTEALAEAIGLAGQALLDHIDDYVTVWHPHASQKAPSPGGSSVIIARPREAGP